MKSKINKNIVPQGFTLQLALVDFLPVFFFTGSCIILGSKLRNTLFILGAAVCMAAGLLKVLWKILVVIRKKNYWPLFMQMRIAMPIGFLMMIAGLVTGHSASAVFSNALKMPSVLFFIAGFLGMCMMFVFMFRLDASDSRSNWIEQLTNTAAQLCILIGVILL